MSTIIENTFDNISDEEVLGRYIFIQDVDEANRLNPQSFMLRDNKPPENYLSLVRTSKVESVEKYAEGIFSEKKRKKLKGCFLTKTDSIRQLPVAPLELKILTCNKVGENNPDSPHAGLFVWLPENKLLEGSTDDINVLEMQRKLAELAQNSEMISI